MENMVYPTTIFQNDEITISNQKKNILTVSEVTTNNSENKINYSSDQIR